MLSVRCLSVCLSVSDDDILWPNGCTDEDETWYGGWPRPRSHCVRYGPSSTPRGIASQVSAHVCCSQKAGWIKMPLGMKVCLSPGDIVLDGDPLPSPNRDQSPLIFGPCLLWPRSPISATAELLLRYASGETVKQTYIQTRSPQLRTPTAAK